MTKKAPGEILGPFVFFHDGCSVLGCLLGAFDDVAGELAQRVGAGVETAQVFQCRRNQILRPALGFRHAQPGRIDEFEAESGLRPMAQKSENSAPASSKGLPATAPSAANTATG